MKIKTQNACKCRMLLFMGLCLSGVYLYAADDGNAERNVSAVQTVQAVSQAKFKVTGVVKDINGEPVIGATVTVKDAPGGTLTDLDGKFTIDVANENSVVVVSFIGFNSQEIKVYGKNEKK